MSNKQFNDLHAKFKTRKPSRKIANNTYALRYMAKWPHVAEPRETIAVILHRTAIVYHCQDASASFNHEWVDSRTTRARMRRPQGGSRQFDKGALTGTAELPYLSEASKCFTSCVKGVRVAKDLSSTYVVETFAGRTTIWQPTSNGPVAYDVRTDTVAIDRAIRAMCKDVWDRFGELHLIGEATAFGDTDLVDKNVARATKLFLDGAKPDEVVDALVFRRKRPANLKGRLSKRVQAVGVVRAIADMITENSDNYRSVWQFTSARQLLGETHLVNRNTGACVPLNLDEPEKQGTWALSAARKHMSEANEQVVPKAGEARDDAGLGRGAGRVEALAGQEG